MNGQSYHPEDCPLCGEANKCALAVGKSSCWCFDFHIPQSVLDRVPDKARDIACVCRDCAESASESRCCEHQGEPGCAVREALE